MMILGSGTIYIDGVEIGESTSVCVELENETLSNHFKSVKLNGKELVSGRRDNQK